MSTSVAVQSEHPAFECRARGYSRATRALLARVPDLTKKTYENNDIAHLAAPLQNLARDLLYLGSTATLTTEEGFVMYSDWEDREDVILDLDEDQGVEAWALEDFNDIVADFN
jgi:hypothetical protein